MTLPSKDVQLIGRQIVNKGGEKAIDDRSDDARDDHCVGKEKCWEGRNEQSQHKRNTTNQRARQVPKY